MYKYLYSFHIFNKFIVGELSTYVLFFVLRELKKKWVISFQLKLYHKLKQITFEAYYRFG